MATSQQTVTDISIRNVLIATDFSRQSSGIVDAGMSFCHAYGAHVSILYVLSTSEFALAGFEAYAAARDVAQRDLVALQERLQSKFAKGLSPDYELLISEGDVAASIFECVRERHIDLIVLGTHGRSGLSKALLGSVAENIFRHAEVPVLTVGPCARHMPASGPKRLLVPVDFTAASQHSSAYACALARKHEAELVLIHVIGDAPRHGSMADIECLKRGVEQRLTALIQLECKPDHVEFIIEFGGVVPTVLRKANELHPDLMVLGAHEYPHLLDQFRRKPAYELVREAPCPVLTVR